MPYSHPLHLHSVQHPAPRSNFTTASTADFQQVTQDGHFIKKDYCHGHLRRHPHQHLSQRSLLFASSSSPLHRAQQVHLSSPEKTTCHSATSERRVSLLLTSSAKNTSSPTSSVDHWSPCTLSRSRHLLSPCYPSPCPSPSLSSSPSSPSSSSSVHLSPSTPSPSPSTSTSTSTSSDDCNSSHLPGRASYYSYTSPPRTSASLEPLAIKNQIFTHEGTQYPSASSKYYSPAISNCNSEVEVRKVTSSTNSTINTPNSNSNSNCKSQVNDTMKKRAVFTCSRQMKCCSRSRLTYLVVILALITLPSIDSCGPGRGGNRRRSPRKLTPLVFKQHVPNVRENTITASGFPEGAINRENPRFKDLVPNYNQDILFKDEEGTGADRLMTRRLKEKLNTLAISVMNHWRGVRLRVTEGWDEERQHSIESLHYEGRAVDITTSDRDRRKYGMLARLAVEAGFDWVYYESRYHIHCSVKSEKADSSRAGGCFDGSSSVITRSGRVKMSELKVGDDVLTVDSESNKTVFSPVIMFMDRDVNRTHDFFTLTTSSGRQLTLTGSHLVYVKEDGEDENVSESQEHVSFARQVIPGQWLRVLDATVGQVKFEKVINVQIESKTGAFAPLTETGNLLVNQVLASCYANINDQWLAHASFLPVRISSSLLRLLPGSSERRIDEEPQQNGVHWYPRMLKWIADRILPARFVD